MFSIADRYIGKQVFLTTLFSVSVLTLILVLGTLFKEIRFFLVENNAPLGLVGKFLLTFIPYSMMFTLPWGFLSAVLLVFGRLSSQNEIVSMRMAGRNLPRIALPVYILSILFSSLGFWINSEIAPFSRDAREKLILEAVKKDPSALLDPGVIKNRFDEGKVYVEDREEDILHGFHFYQLGDTSEQKDSTYLHANKADLLIDEEAKQIRLSLIDTYIETKGENGKSQFALAGTAEPLLFDYGEKENRQKRPKEMTSSSIRKEMQNNENIPEKRLNRMRYELGRRSSLSLACFSFAMIGFPLALNSRRKETSAGLIISLLIAGFYFAMMIVAKNSDEQGHILVWIPNIFCFIVGLLLLWRAKFR